MKKLLAIILTVCLVAGLASALTIAISANSTSAPDISAYVSDGLVNYYTAGYHSEDGKTWYDATGSNTNIDLSSYDTANNYFDDANGVFVNNSTKVFFDPSIAALISTGKFTTEMVVKNTEVLGTSYGTYMNSTNDYYSLFIRLSSPLYSEFKCGSNTRPKVEITDKDFYKNSTVTITFDSSTGVNCMYVNGQLLQSQTATAPFSIDDFYFGHNDAAKAHNTEFAGFRFYNRALTAEEVAANYAADTNTAVVPEESSEETSEPSATLTNIASGKTYTVTLSDVGTENYGYSADDNGGYGDGDQGQRQRLTDGVIADDGGGYGVIGAYSAKKAEIVVDLGESMTIGGFNFDQFYELYGIVGPISVEYLVSEDGADYTSEGVVALENAQPKTSLNGKAADFKLILDTPVTGRYVKVVALANDYVWGSEIEVYEGTAVTEESSAAEISEGTSTAETSETTPITGDTGIIALAIISVIAIAGAVVIKRK